MSKANNPRVQYHVDHASDDPVCASRVTLYVGDNERAAIHFFSGAILAGRSDVRASKEVIKRYILVNDEDTVAWA